jgi:hypothetical protein
MQLGQKQQQVLAAVPPHQAVASAAAGATSLAALQMQLGQQQQQQVLAAVPSQQAVVPSPAAGAVQSAAAAEAWLRGLATAELAELIAAAGAEMAQRMRG